MAINLIEDITNTSYTADKKEEKTINMKVNKYGGNDDYYAFLLLDNLKKRKINVSKHIRMLLALEYQGKIMFDGSVSDSIKDEVATCSEEYIAPVDMDSIF